MANVAESWASCENAEIPAAEIISEDEISRRRAEHLIRDVGSLAVRHAADGPEAGKVADASQYPTLMDAIRCAAGGDETARQVVEVNTRTHVWECLTKAGTVFDVALEVNERGSILQNGQLLTDVYRNALRYAAATPEMRQRTEAEIHNGMLMESLLRLGVLEGHYVVVLSRYPDNMTDEAAEKVGFFSETKSCAIQTITVKDGQLVQETALVAGLAGPGAERHDQQAIEGMAQELGISVTGKSATELLATPILVDKRAMPNGAVSLVELYDRCAGNGVFFGQGKPAQDYLRYAAGCRERQAELEPTVQAIVAAILARREAVKDPLDAIKLLHQVAQRYAVDRAFEDASIDARVFGREAAQYIEDGRRYLQGGNLENFQKARDSAQNTARTSSCPLAMKSYEQEDGSTSDGNAVQDKSEDIGEIHTAVCRTPGCPSRPGKTKVGGCDICLHYCQGWWDQGIDPETVYGAKKDAAKSPQGVVTASIDALLKRREQREKRKVQESSTQKTGQLAVIAAGVAA